MMMKLAANVTMDTMAAVLFLRLFAVKICIPVAPMHIFAVPALVGVVVPMEQLAVKEVVVRLLMLFVVALLPVAPMEPNVVDMGSVSGHTFCLC